VAVESRGLAGGRPEHAGFGGLSTKPLEDGFLVWASKLGAKDPTRRRRDPGVSGSFEAEDTRRDRMACVRRTRGGIAWLPTKLLHMDLVGTARVRSVGGKWYVLVVDDYSRYAWVFFLEDKSETFGFV
jgi:hypothetical protein